MQCYSSITCILYTIRKKYSFKFVKDKSIIYFVNIQHARTQLEIIQPKVYEDAILDLDLDNHFVGLNVNM